MYWSPPDLSASRPQLAILKLRMVGYTERDEFGGQAHTTLSRYRMRVSFVERSGGKRGTCRVLSGCHIQLDWKRRQEFR